MPAGSNRTGRKMPKMPGSIRDIEERTRTGASLGTGVAQRTAARVRSQDRPLRASTTRKPQSQSPNRMAGIGFEAVAGAGVDAQSAKVNGWPICATDAGMVGRATGVASGHRNRPPMATNKENGTRNFNDAISQTT